MTLRNPQQRSSLRGGTTKQSVEYQVETSKLSTPRFERGVNCLAFAMHLQASKYYNLDLKQQELQTPNHKPLVKNEG